MPNRIIKESINESEGLSECSVFAQDLFKRLITYADDQGRFNADTMIMRARLYPREFSEVTEADIISALIELAGVGKLQFYTPKVSNQGGKKGIYGAFPNWGSHQRVRDSKAKCPDPGDLDVNDWYLRRFVSFDMKVMLLERDGFKCQFCGKYITTCRDARRFVRLGSGLFHVDYIVPVQQGGRATLENLRITCPECSLKRNKALSFKDLVAETCGNSPQSAASCSEPRPESNPIQSNTNPNPNPNISAEQTCVSSTQVFGLPLNDATEYAVTQAQFDKWRELYPAVDVMQELRAMKGWLEANPKKRKTKNGIMRFINGWLARTQDKPHPGMKLGTRLQTKFHNLEEREDDLDAWALEKMQRDLADMDGPGNDQAGPKEGS